MKSQRGWLGPRLPCFMTAVMCVLGRTRCFFISDGEDVNISPYFKERWTNLCCAPLVRGVRNRISFGFTVKVKWDIAPWIISHCQEAPSSCAQVRFHSRHGFTCGSVGPGLISADWGDILSQDGKGPERRKVNWAVWRLDTPPQDSRRKNKFAALLPNEERGLEDRVRGSHPGQTWFLPWKCDAASPGEKGNGAGEMS